MRYLLLLVLLIPVNAFAEVYVLTDSRTGQVLSVSEKDDTVPSQDQEITTLPGDFSNYNFQENPNYYDLKNSKFVLNVGRQSSDQLKQQRERARELELAMIEKKSFLDAKKALEASGEVFNEVKDEELTP